MSRLAYRHQRVQRLRRLVGRRSARKDEGRFVIEGVNLLEEALESEARIEAVYVDGKWGQEGRQGNLGGSEHEAVPLDEGSTNRLGPLLRRCYERGARVFDLEPGVLERVAGTVTPQPVMAVVETPTVVLADVLSAGPKLLVVCVDVRDPGNAGTVVRSAWAAGADAVVSCEGTVDLWNPKAVRASAGAVLHLRVVAAGSAVPVLEEIGQQGLQRWGTVKHGGADYAAQDLTPPSALVLGNEASGLQVVELGHHLDGLVSIPMQGGAESLNVGMAAAVLCFEVARQRRYGRPLVGSTRVATGRETELGV